MTKNKKKAKIKKAKALEPQQKKAIVYDSLNYDSLTTE